MGVMTQEEREAARDRIMREIGMTPTTEPPGGRPGLVSKRAQLPIEEEMNQIQSQYGFGEVWGRPGLSVKLRSFITLGLLTVLGHSDELETHINVALHLGITPEEIHETLMHAGVYGGLPKWNHGSNVAHKVFLEHGILKED
jgi:4-carboxymuconolactone decarboxylase